VKVREMAETRIKNRTAKVGMEDTEYRQGDRERRMVAGHWSRATIYKILKDPINIGVFYHYRKKDGKRTDRSQWVAVPIDGDPIIPQAQFDRIQKRLAQGRELSQRRSKLEYLLRCRIRCICGYARGGLAGGNHRPFYECMIRKERDRKCSHPYYRADHVDATVWHWIETVVLDEENLRAGLELKHTTIANERAKLDTERALYNEQRAKIEQEKERLLDVFLSKLITKEEFAEKRAQLDGSLLVIAAEIANIDTRSAG
jgi:hypothetical protein